MRTAARRGALAPLFLAASALGAAAPPDVTAALDRPSVMVGDRVVATYVARIPEGASVELEALVTPRLPAPPAPAEGAVLEYERPTLAAAKADGGSMRVVTLTVPFAPFAAGSLSVPGPRLVYVSPSGERVPFRPASLAMTVASRLPTGEKAEKLAPRPERPVRIPSFDWRFWGVVGALAAAALALLVVALRRLRRPAAVPGAAPSPRIPAGRELLGALAALEGRVPDVALDPRAFYSDLTHAVKRYLERRLDRPVLEWTTFETIRRLRETGVEISREIGLPDLLAGADRVKFGLAAATPPEAARELARARRLHDEVEGILSAAAAPAAAPVRAEARR